MRMIDPLSQAAQVVKNATALERRELAQCEDLGATFIDALIDSGDEGALILLADNNSLCEGHLWRIAAVSPDCLMSTWWHPRCPIPLLLGANLLALPTYQIERLAVYFISSPASREEFAARVEELKDDFYRSGARPAPYVQVAAVISKFTRWDLGFLTATIFDEVLLRQDLLGSAARC